MNTTALIDELRVNALLIKLRRLSIIDRRRAAFLIEHAEHDARPGQVGEVLVDHGIDARRRWRQFRKRRRPFRVDLLHQRERFRETPAVDRQIVERRPCTAGALHRGARVGAVGFRRVRRADRVVAQQPASRIRIGGILRGEARPKGEERRNCDDQGHDDIQRLHSAEIRLGTAHPPLSGEITLHAKQTFAVSPRVRL
jgi:hypothetical protein